MKKKINYLSLFKTFKEKITHETKFYLFTRIIPVVGVSYLVYNIYKYNFFSLLWKEHIYSIAEEKQIAKKIFPLLKYKNIENLYDEKSQEYKTIYDTYKRIVSHMKINLKVEVYVIKSDLIYLNLLPNGPLFISDVRKKINVNFYLIL
jgi:hypothetical protein